MLQLPGTRSLDGRRLADVVMLYKLSLLNANRPGLVATWLLKLPATVGRGAEHTVCIQHDSVSRTHCRLALNGEGALLIRDLNSLNGTYVNDQRISQSLLMPGDRIQIGAVTFRIEFATESDHEEAPQQPHVYDLSATVPMQPALKLKSTENP